MGCTPYFMMKDKKKPRPDEWGSIAAWAWALSRALDYFQTDPLVDATKVIAFGHSRLGKTSLWAGISDTRFAGVVSNDSGCGRGRPFETKIRGDRESNKQCVSALVL